MAIDEIGTVADRCEVSRGRVIIWEKGRPNGLRCLRWTCHPCGVQPANTRRFSREDTPSKGLGSSLRT